MGKPLPAGKASTQLHDAPSDLMPLPPTFKERVRQIRRAALRAVVTGITHVPTPAHVEKTMEKARELTRKAGEYAHHLQPSASAIGRALRRHYLALSIAREEARKPEEMLSEKEYRDIVKVIEAEHAQGIQDVREHVKEEKQLLSPEDHYNLMVLPYRLRRLMLNRGTKEKG